MSSVEIYAAFQFLQKFANGRRSNYRFHFNFKEELEYILRMLVTFLKRELRFQEIRKLFCKADLYFHFYVYTFKRAKNFM